MKEETITEYLKQLVTVAGKESSINRFKIMLNGLNNHINTNMIKSDSVITDIPIILTRIINELKECY
jgi:hypothetical protein